eukprot:COSAG02_NODE_8763_length_2452_cov_11.538462_1_plen_144_part_10
MPTRWCVQEQGVHIRRSQVFQTTAERLSDLLLRAGSDIIRRSACVWRFFLTPTCPWALRRGMPTWMGELGLQPQLLLVFRANLAYQRYWEAITRITELISKLRDVAIQVATFVQSNDDDAASWKSTQLRRLALYNSLAIMELRD